MSDPFRTDTARAFEPGSDADTEAKIEELLLAGLEHYFAARYDQAINVWTRALFLDRNHARARAYIERARSALAERQREAEELLQGGVAAFDRGDVNEARRLLQSAMDQGAPPEEALGLLDRLARLGQLAPGPIEAARPRPRTAASARARLSAGVWLLVGLLTLIILVAAGMTVGELRSEWRALVEPPAAAPSRPASDALPVPRRGELAMVRARALLASGRLHDALAVLAQVRATDPQKLEADRLRSDIQRQLIAMSAPSIPPLAAPGSTP